MKKATKKLFAALMAVLMIVSVFSLSAFAYDRNGKPVKKIVMLGDSIAAGFSLPDYDRRGVYCLQNKRVKGSFGDIVATKLGVTGKNYTPYVSPGFRTKEIRVFLENDYEGDFVTQNFIGSLSGNPNYNLEVMKSKRETMQKKISRADMIILEIGFNDTWLTTMGAYTDFSAIQDTLFNFGNEFSAIVNDLYRLNPTATLVVVGVYNPFKDWTIPDGSMIYAGQLLNFMYNNMNNAMRSHANDGIHDYVFVDVERCPCPSEGRLGSPSDRGRSPVHRQPDPDGAGCLSNHSLKRNTTLSDNIGKGRSAFVCAICYTGNGNISVIYKGGITNEQEDHRSRRRTRRTDRSGTAGKGRFRRHHLRAERRGEARL